MQFRRVGFAAATVDEIAARAGTSRPTFYAHFKSKMDVANQIGIRTAPDTEAVFQQLDAEQRELAHARLILLKMAQERLFFVTRIRGVRFPGADELDALADIWWTVLFAPQRAGRGGS